MNRTLIAAVLLLTCLCMLSCGQQEAENTENEYLEEPAYRIEYAALSSGESVFLFALGEAGTTGYSAVWDGTTLEVTSPGPDEIISEVVHPFPAISAPQSKPEETSEITFTDHEGKSRTIPIEENPAQPSQPGEEVPAQAIIREIKHLKFAIGIHRTGGYFVYWENGQLMQKLEGDMHTQVLSPFCAGTSAAN